MTPTTSAQSPTGSKTQNPAVAGGRAAAIDEALREFSRSGKGRRNKYEIALDALIRVEDAFAGDHGDEYERVLAVLREKADRD